MEKRKFLAILLLSTLIISVYFLFERGSSLTGLFRTLWGILMPFFLGGVLAFVLNVPLRFFERLLLFFMDRSPGLRRFKRPARLRKLHSKRADYSLVCRIQRILRCGERLRQRFKMGANGTQLAQAGYIASSINEKQQREQEPQYQRNIAPKRNILPAQIGHKRHKHHRSKAKSPKDPFCFQILENIMHRCCTPAPYA